jgi:ABC-type branched-subunit amino acid transport system substrate-binding protein
MRFVSPYYWDVFEGSRAFAERFRKRMGTIPSEAQLADYTAARHYLRAVQATGSDHGDVVVAKMKELKVEDGITQNGYIRRGKRRLPAGGQAISLGSRGVIMPRLLASEKQLGKGCL